MTWLWVLFVATWGLLCLGLLWSGRPLRALLTHLGRLRARLARFRRLRKVPAWREHGRPLNAREKAALDGLLASYRCLTVAEPVYERQQGRKRP